MNNDQQKRQDQETGTELVQVFNSLENIVFKSFLEQLEDASVYSPAGDDGVDRIKLQKIERIVYDKDEDNIEKLNNVFSAVHSTEGSVCFVLKGNKEKTDLYIGTKYSGSDKNYADEPMESLENAVKGNFPGIVGSQSRCTDKEIEELLYSHLDGNNGAIASVTGVPSLKSEKQDKNEGFIQGIEKVIESLQKKDYTCLLIGSPVKRTELERVEKAYQEIYSYLSFLEESQVTLSVNESESIGKTISESFSRTISESISKTQTHSTSTNYSHNSGTAHTKNPGAAVAAGATLGGAAIGTIICPGIGTLIGGLIGGGLGAVAGPLIGSNTKNESDNVGGGTGEGIGTGKINTKIEGETETIADNKTSTHGTSRSILYKSKNRMITEYLTILDEQLKRIRSCKNYGMWNWGAYFISNEYTVVKTGAEIYSGILCGETTGLERNGITIWTKDGSGERYNNISLYLKQLDHPFFRIDQHNGSYDVMSSSLISTKELTVGMNLPQKSLPGIPVLESVEFGRSVFSLDRKDESPIIKIGNISHLGIIDKEQPVELNINSLTSHTFITGSTGTGKTNIIFEMLHLLKSKENPIPFLVIEPVKGEYKNTFGADSDVNVFGTNPNCTPLLKINPFSFPEKDIHIIEHIDRFIEILNACWPMYAAMPAILKEALELTYEKLGWDLRSSKNKYSQNIFPDFHDLLEVLPEVIKNSQYSEEIKSNYTGALITRIKSLTNGYFSSIFQKDEIESEKLFDSSCIIDLSRVGSSETKALLMGIIFLKLNEYRMSQHEVYNSDLKHITVIEEAHHLLKNSLTGGDNQELANLQGKAVEMIANAIAEMRTYGEGFVIADQAPELLDRSVIRNTNTKIILRLPDWDDRMLVGKAENLKEVQIEELARLQTGCGALYQNNWEQAVLCQFEEFKSANTEVFNHNLTGKLEQDPRLLYTTELLRLLLDAKISNKEPAELAKENEEPLAKYSRYYPEIIDRLNKNDMSIQQAVLKILNIDEVIDNIPNIVYVDDWFPYLFNNGIRKKVDIEILGDDFSWELQKTILDGLAEEDPKNKEPFKGLKEKIENDRKGVR